MEILTEFLIKFKKINYIKEGSDIVVELDSMKQTILSYNEPMIEMRDSL